MIYPHLPIVVFKNKGSNIYGEATYGPPQHGEKCAPVRLRFMAANTTVRTDSAGTRGHAEEEVAQVRILVLPTSKIRIDDKLHILDTPVRVIGREPRFSVSGKLDHYELLCDQKVTADANED